MLFCPLRRKTWNWLCCCSTRVYGKGAFNPSMWPSPAQSEVCQELCMKSVGFRRMISVSTVYNYWRCLSCKLMEEKALLVPIKLKHVGGYICTVSPSISSRKHASSPHWFGFGSGCCCDGAALDFPASVFWWYNHYRLALNPTGLVPTSPCSSQLLPERTAHICSSRRVGRGSAAQRSRQRLCDKVLPAQGWALLICAAAGEAARRAALRSSSITRLNFRGCSKLFFHFIYLILCQKVGGVGEGSLSKLDARGVFIIRAGGLFWSGTRFALGSLEYFISF